MEDIPAQAVEKIGPEDGRVRGKEIHVGRRDDPRIGFDFFRSADGVESPFLENPEQPALHGERQAGDLVEEEGSRSGRLELSSRGSIRA
ncbi:MAG: hypothetical protein Q7J17_05815, partial [Candidatus Deferrimicrobium sp.]